MQTSLLYLGAPLSLVNLWYFAWRMSQKKIPATNTASWLMWVIMDGVLLGSTIATKQPAWLPLSYILGAAAVLGVHVKLGKWKWTWTETISAAGVTVATILWQALNAEAGIVAGVMAMNVAGIPLLIDMWRVPNRGTFPMFFITVIVCSMTLLATWPWTIGGSLLAFSGLMYNGFVAWLVRPRVEH